jgi:hypothetical protein
VIALEEELISRRGIMRKKVGILVFLFIPLSFCASGPRSKIWTPRSSGYGIKPEGRPIAQEILTFEDLSYDRLWETCEKVLVDFEYIFYTSDKEKGNILVRTVAVPSEMSSIVTKTDSTSDEREIYLYLIISQKDEKLTLACQAFLDLFYSSPDGPDGYYPGPQKKNIILNEMARFLKELKKKIKR